MWTLITEITSLPLKIHEDTKLQAIEAPEMGVAWDYSAFIVHIATAFLVTAVVSTSVLGCSRGAGWGVLGQRK